MSKLSVGIITINNRCCLYDEVDYVGAEIVRMVNQGALRDCVVVKACIMPENVDLLKKKVKDWCVANNLQLILTVGGIEGDLVKAALSPLMERELPGMLTLLKRVPFKEQENAICGYRGNTLIVTLPGDTNKSKNCLGSIKESINHSVFLLTGFGESSLVENQIARQSNIQLNSVKLQGQDSRGSITLAHNLHGKFL